MTTHYGGIGNVNDSEPQNINANILDPDEYQVGLRALTRELKKLGKLLRPMIMTLWMP